MQTLSIQSLNVDEKWVGAPFAAVLRRHHSSLNDVTDSDLRVAFIMLSSTSNVKQIKYGSILLQVQEVHFYVLDVHMCKMFYLLLNLYEVLRSTSSPT